MVWLSSPNQYSPNPMWKAASDAKCVLCKDISQDNSQPTNRVEEASVSSQPSQATTQIITKEKTLKACASSSEEEMMEFMNVWDCL